MSDLAADRRAQLLSHWESVFAQQKAVVRETSQFLRETNQFLIRSTAFAHEQRRRLSMIFLRTLIRTKLNDGRLPWERPGVIPRGPAIGGRCDACDQAMAPRRLVMDIQTHSGRPVHLHADCFVIWDEERQKPRQTIA